MQFNLDRFAAIANSIEPEFHSEFDPMFGSNVNSPIEQGLSDFAAVVGNLDFRSALHEDVSSKLSGIDPAKFSGFKADEEDPELRESHRFYAPTKSHSDVDDIPDDKSFDDFLADIGHTDRSKVADPTGVSGEEGDDVDFERMLADLGQKQRESYSQRILGK